MTKQDITNKIERYNMVGLGIRGTIDEIKKSRIGENRSWIYDENGNISDNVICGDIIPYLEELKEYEIGVTEEFLERFIKDENTKCFYTYNYGCCIDKDIAFWYKTDGSDIVVGCVHLQGDARTGFSDNWFALKMDDYWDNCPLTQLLQLNSVYQIVDIDNRYYADIDIFSESYEIYDSEKGETVCTDYSLDKKDVLKKIKENRN